MGSGKVIQISWGCTAMNILPCAERFTDIKVQSSLHWGESGCALCFFSTDLENVGQQDMPDLSGSIPYALGGCSCSCRFKDVFPGTVKEQAVSVQCQDWKSTKCQAWKSPHTCHKTVCVTV